MSEPGGAVASIRVRRGRLKAVASMTAAPRGEPFDVDAEDERGRGGKCHMRACFVDGDALPCGWQA